jgi:hypothetical protein
MEGYDWEVKRGFKLVVRRGLAHLVWVPQILEANRNQYQKHGTNWQGSIDNGTRNSESGLLRFPAWFIATLQTAGSASASS